MFETTTFLKFPFFTTVESLRFGDEFQEIFQILSLLVLELLRVTVVEKTHQTKNALILELVLYYYTI